MTAGHLLNLIRIFIARPIPYFSCFAIMYHDFYLFIIFHPLSNPILCQNMLIGSVSICKSKNILRGCSNLLHGNQCAVLGSSEQRVSWHAIYYLYSTTNRWYHFNFSIIITISELLWSRGQTFCLVRSRP